MDTSEEEPAEMNGAMHRGCRPSTATTKVPPPRESATAASAHNRAVASEVRPYVVVMADRPISVGEELTVHHGENNPRKHVVGDATI